ncbi:WYL domain-containing protein [Candidatus Villigracilis affinis]|uniref:helix-turn-helix transcriptional regulator n=1 Tax=Candidatus Villigracilis affinis TaxID=3140682 RepID=UPI002A2365BB|nr:WYL domain-containing protein [Anaerolineales bacterium]
MAQRLEVNIRTLRRYIVMLQDLGIPIEAERGRNGAYVLSAGFKLPPMMFTNEKAGADGGLISAHRLNLADTGYAVESALAKLERVMPLDLKSRVRALTETITLDLKAESTAPTSEIVLSTWSSAAQLQRRVHIHYRPDQGEETERDFDPYGLTYFQNKWYVIGPVICAEVCARFGWIASAESKPSKQDSAVDGFDALGHIMAAIATLPRKYPFELLLNANIRDRAARGLRCARRFGSG